MNRLRRSIVWATCTVAVAGGVGALAGAVSAGVITGYGIQVLASDQPIGNIPGDPDLINTWGLAFNPAGTAWIADNGTGVSTLFDGAGNKQSLRVTIPPPPGGASPSHPTGIVFSGGTDFVVNKGGVSGPARFLFATEDGTIAAWVPNVDFTHAIVVADRSADHAIYKGIALGGNGRGHLLYATDFHNNRIDVFGATFHRVTVSGHFSDPAIPRGYAPFGIQNILGDLYVTYAKQDDAREDDVPGAGFGFVDVFDADGFLIRRVASGGELNAPWGLALAPADFGPLSNRLLVGNFGDGRINAFDLATGDSMGPVSDIFRNPLIIENLWGLAFGDGVDTQPTHTLFFTAGPGDERHGMFGRIDPREGPVPVLTTTR